MSTIVFEDRTVARAEGESVLDALLRAGASVPHSCKAGACQACMMEMVEGDAGPDAQAGLRPSYVARHLFLACQCRPAGDVSVRLPGPGQDCAAVLRSVAPLAADVDAVVLEIEDDPAAYRAGQYVTLIRPEDGLARSYSIANLPDRDGVLELHVRRFPGGRMSGWLHDLPPGAPLRLRGPAGDCVYDSGAPEAPLLLAGTGTGLAPLLGVARDALRCGHAGPIRLFHGARDADGLYLADALRALAGDHANLDCRFSVLGLTEDDGDMLAGSIADRAQEALRQLGPALANVYFCGAPDLVKDLKMKAFIAGVPSKAIHSDPFLPPAD